MCHLYGMQTKHAINNTRGTKTAHAQQLPPTQDEFQKHVKCWNYQSYVWKQALVSNPDISCPSGHEWLLRDDLSKIHWMENMPAPESVLKMRVCECRKSACTNTCQCRILRLECTNLCKGSGSCNNETETNNIESKTDDESDDNSKQSEASDTDSEGEN